MTKKILLVLVLVAIVGAIWYLESFTAHPGTGNSTSQTINITSVSSSPLNMSTSGSGGAMPAQGTETLQSVAAADVAAGYKPAIEISDPTGFINATSGFQLSHLVGKDVILLDFWTYSCINCIRTLPYLTAWYQKYKDQGLVVVGIHTPEFDFEKDINNVEAATQRYGITYPVVLDSNYGTWTAYGNLYWPHEYLIDIAGYIVHDQVGEGGYADTEATIQKLLQQRAAVLGTNMSAISTSTVNVQASDLSGINSPETYFGSARNETLSNGTPLTPGNQTLQEPQSTTLNDLYLVGSWNFQDQYATNNAAGAKIIFEYDSAKVFFVASAPSGATVEVLQDGAPVTAAAGSDVQNGKMTITSSRLYNVINNPDGPGEHTLELIIDSPGLQAFTFTFG